MVECAFLFGERTCLPASGKIYGLFSCVAPFFFLRTCVRIYFYAPLVVLYVCVEVANRILYRADIVRCDLISNKIAGII